ncbi:MAG: trimeric autotransporter adhesin [Verrucomicrobiota bacterium]
MLKNRASESGLFNPRIFVAFLLCSAGSWLALLSLASTPSTSTVTVPSTVGQTVTVTWTGTIPPLVNATSNCAPLADTPAVDQHVSTINVPPGAYNSVSAQFTFNISWTPVTNSSASDEVLTVVGIGSSDGGNPSETVAAQNLDAGNYKIIACGFTNAQPQPYTGTLTITTSAPAAAPPPNYTTGAINFGPANVVDFQRTEGEPLLHLDKDAKYWESGPWGFSTTTSFMHRSVDGGDQFNVVSPTELRPNPPPGGGDTTHAIDDQGVVYFGDLEGALEELDCSVSNDDGNTWKKNPACVQATGTDRQWLAIDNGSDHTIGAAGAADNTVFYAFHDVALGHLIYSSPGSTGTSDLNGGLVFTSAVADPTGLFYSGGGNCGELVFDPVSRNLYYPCQAGNHVEVIVGHVNPGQRTGLTFTTHVLANSPGGSVSNLFPPLSVDSAGNVYVVWSDPGDHNLYYAYSTNQGTTWSPTVKINQPPAKSNVFAWAEAGTAGNLVAVWLGNNSTALSDNMPNWATDPAAAALFPWYGYVALIKNANTASPLIEQDRFTEKPMHYGQICNSGIGCTAQVPQGDRTMADFLSVDLAPDGAIQILFNDVSSQYHGAHLFLARQLTGPSAIDTTLSKPVQVSPVFDPTGDAQVPHYAPVVGAGANVPQLDFTQVSMTQPNATTLRVSMTLNSLSSLLPPPGKANAFWITRFQALSKNDAGTGEAYRIFYLGAESVGGAPPIFFAGSPNLTGAPAGCIGTTPGTCKVVEYPAEITSLTGPVTGSVNGNTLCIDLPLDAFGPNRPIGNALFNVTAFSGGRDNVAADVYTEGDSTRSFDFPLGNISTGALLSVVSRKVHGTAGTFDINLPLTGPSGVECRRPGSTGDPNPAVDYKLVFTFAGQVTSCGTANTGTVSNGPNPNQCTVNLTGVPNAQYVTVTLTGVSVPTACPSFAGNVSATMGVLWADVNSSRQVDSGDVFLVQKQNGQGLPPVGAADFRRDINMNGIIDSGDLFLTQKQNPSALPAQPAAAKSIGKSPVSFRETRR